MAKNGRSIPDDCERTVIVALPAAASTGFISGELGTSATLDAFSTVLAAANKTDRQIDTQYAPSSQLHLKIRQYGMQS